MSLAHRIHYWLTILMLPALLAACGSTDSADLTVATIGGGDDPFEKGVRLSVAGQLVRASTAEGLVAFDEESRVIPAVAERWIVTDDGQSYIFRLRSGTWRDGTPISSKSVVTALNASIRALRGTSLGLDLGGIDEIRDRAGRVVEIRLTQPMPYFLQILAQPELGLLHGGKGVGPMQMEREGDMAILTPIQPEELGLPPIADWKLRTRPIYLASWPAKEAVERFNRGEADIVMGGRIGDFPHSASVGILRGTIQLDPVIGLFGLRVSKLDNFLAEAANREAVAMAIDREALIARFGIDGWRPSTRVVPSDLEGDLGTIGERWSDMTIDGRRALASARVALWRNSRPQNEPVRLRIGLPDGPGSDILFSQLEEDFAAIGIEAVRASGGGKADLRLIDTVARYPRATWFLNRLNCKVQKGPCDSDADARVAEASKTDDPAERSALLAEAEAELTEANIYIPFGSPVRWSLVRSDVNAFEANGWAWHPLMPMALRTK